jgi:hypothetical protein
MAARTRETELQGLYGALLGWLIASLIGVAMVWGLTNAPQSAYEHTALAAGLIGLSCVVAFMIGGLYAIDCPRWIGSTLLFAAGFTALWSGGMLLSSEPKPVALAAVAAAVGVGVFTGWRRLGSRRVEPSAPAETPAL